MTEPAEPEPVGRVEVEVRVVEMEMQEVRCVQCKRLLGKVEKGAKQEIKCPRCRQVVKG